MAFSEHGPNHQRVLVSTEIDIKELTKKSDSARKTPSEFLGDDRERSKARKNPGTGRIVCDASKRWRWKRNLTDDGRRHEGCSRFIFCPSYERHSDSRLLRTVGRTHQSSFFGQKINHPSKLVDFGRFLRADTWRNGESGGRFSACQTACEYAVAVSTAKIGRQFVVVLASFMPLLPIARSQFFERLIVFSKR